MCTMAKKQSNREFPAKRKFALRRDASVAAGQREKDPGRSNSALIAAGREFVEGGFQIQATALLRGELSVSV
jgi:hypothetical protein